MDSLYYLCNMNIEKEFAPYQESLELKKLGFDEPCFGYYLCENSAFGVRLEVTTDWIDLLPYDSSSCKAPTYSQAFRWFREKYNMKPCFDWHPTEEYRYCIYYSINTYFEQCDFLTHEEAELACLRKLIEIVKNKS